MDSDEITKALVVVQDKLEALIEQQRQIVIEVQLQTSEAAKLRAELTESGRCPVLSGAPPPPNGGCRG